MSGLVDFENCDTNLQCSAGELTKTGGDNWNTGSGARSNYGFKEGEGIAIQFKCPTTSAYRMIGFALDTYPTSSSYSNGYTQLLYSIYCVHGGGISFYESGSSTSGHTYVPTDTLQVRMHPDGTVDYTKNGNVIRTSSVTNTQWPVFAAASIYTSVTPSINEIEYVPCGH